MQIQNIQNQSFNGIHVKTSSMNSIQKKLANKVVDGITYSDQYVKACDMGIDLCLFGNPKNKEGVVVKFLDRDSESFVRDKSNKKPLERAFVLSGGVEKLLNLLNDVVSGVYPFKDVDPIALMDDTNTDMAKLYKNLEDSEIDDGPEIIEYFRNNKNI
ncbi:hypothetical protein IKB17_04745 [bacterium]|nr:hypothetical protein [bacterium]